MNKTSRMASNVIYMMFQGMKGFDHPNELHSVEESSVGLGFVECVLTSFQEDLCEAIAKNEQEFIQFVRESMISELSEGTYFQRPLWVYLNLIDDWFDGFEAAIPFVKEAFVEAHQKYISWLVEK